MTRNSYEGITIILSKECSFTITPELMEIKLDSYDIDSISLNYEENFCGCCEGDHCTKKINPSDLFDFIDSGGKDNINKMNNENKELKKDKVKLKLELKKYKDIIGDLKK